MILQTEAKLQCWRALARTATGERLLYLGRSSTQVRSGYTQAFDDVLDEKEQGWVREIVLERWNGAADEGAWTPQGTLAIPALGTTS
jgi:hypothetical protein